MDIFCIELLFFVLCCSFQGYHANIKTAEINGNSRFEYESEVIALTGELLNSTWKITSPESNKYTLRVFFNNLHVLDVNDSLVTMEELATRYMADRLRVVFTEDGNFQLQMAPSRLPALYRLTNKLEYLKYHVKFQDWNESEEFVTEVINNCDTMDKRGMRDASYSHNCSGHWGYQNQFPKIIIIGTMAAFLIVVSMFACWILRGQKNVFRKKHRSTTIRRNSSGSVGSKTNFKKSVSFAGRSESFSSSIGINMVPKVVHTKSKKEKNSPVEKKLEKKHIMSLSTLMLAPVLSNDQIAEFFQSEAPIVVSILKRPSEDSINIPKTSAFLNTAFEMDSHTSAITEPVPDVQTQQEDEPTSSAGEIVTNSTVAPSADSLPTTYQPVKQSTVIDIGDNEVVVSESAETTKNVTTPKLVCPVKQQTTKQTETMIEVLESETSSETTNIATAVEVVGNCSPKLMQKTSFKKVTKISETFHGDDKKDDFEFKVDNTNDESRSIFSGAECSEEEEEKYGSLMRNIVKELPILNSTGNTLSVAKTNADEKTPSIKSNPSSVEDFASFQEFIPSSVDSYVPSLQKTASVEGSS